MSSDVTKAKDKLAEALNAYDTYMQPEVPGYLPRTLDLLESVAKSSRELLAALDAQPSRQGKPYRVTFQHTKGPLAGKVMKNSHTSIDGAVSWMRTAMRMECRIELSVRDPEDGNYHALSARALAMNGCDEFLDYKLYGDAHYSQEDPDWKPGDPIPPAPGHGYWEAGDDPESGG